MAIPNCCHASINFHIISSTGLLIKSYLSLFIDRCILCHIARGSIQGKELFCQFYWRILSISKCNRLVVSDCNTVLYFRKSNRIALNFLVLILIVISIIPSGRNRLYDLVLNSITLRTIIINYIDRKIRCEVDWFVRRSACNEVRNRVATFLPAVATILPDLEIVPICRYISGG